MSDGTTRLGQFVWRELVTTNVDRAQRFYSELFGWRITTGPMGGMNYSMIHLGDKPIGGMLQMERSDAPPNWLGYVSVSNVDEAAKRALSSGGKVAVDPRDIPDVGRFAVVLDPQGCATAPYRSRGADGPNERPTHGMFVWEELQAKDPSAAEGFYSNVYGWQAETFANVPGLKTFKFGEARVASLAKAPPGLPPHWRTFVSVDKLANPVNRVKQLGGTVLSERIDVPTVGIYAIIRDPDGAVICAFEPSM